MGSSQSTWKHPERSPTHVPGAKFDPFSVGTGLRAQGAVTLGQRVVSGEGLGAVRAAGGTGGSVHLWYLNTALWSEFMQCQKDGRPRYGATAPGGPRPLQLTCGSAC